VGDIFSHSYILLVLGERGGGVGGCEKTYPQGGVVGIR